MPISPFSSEGQLALSVRLWRARTTSAWRALKSIAQQEPAWLILVGVLCGGALIAAGPKLMHSARPGALAAVTFLLTALLEASRTDARLVAVMGGSFALVRFVDATLWLSPLLLLAAVLEPWGALTAVLGIAAASVAPTWRPSGSRRTYRPFTRLAALGAIEWIAGIRRAPWWFAGSTLAGVLGPPHPLLTVATMLASTVAATSYHWAPREGWLIVHAADRGPRGFLWHKIGVSSALLACALFAIVASALARAPSLPVVYSFTALVCLHAHVCGILCRYVPYQQGVRLSAGGWLTWFLSAALVVFPPAALIVLFLLERRAVQSLAPYCRSSTMGHK